MSQSRTAYRSVRYTSVRKEAYTAGSVPQFRSKRRSMMGSTMQQTEMGGKLHFNLNQLQEAKDIKNDTVQRFNRTDGFHQVDQRSILRRKADTAIKTNTQRDTYIDTFHILMSPLTSKYNQEEMHQSQPMRQLAKENNKQGISALVDANSINSLISLPKVALNSSYYNCHFHQEHSEFTLLDVFDRPYQTLNNICSGVTKELKSNQNALKEIKYQLQQLKQSGSLALASIQQQGQTQISHLWGVLRKAQIKEQERKFKDKREIKELQQQLQKVKNGIQASLQKGEQLQFVIFDCKPFQLEENGSKLTQIYL